MRCCLRDWKKSKKIIKISVNSSEVRCFYNFVDTLWYIAMLVIVSEPGTMMHNTSSTVSRINRLITKLLNALSVIRIWSICNRLPFVSLRLGYSPKINHPLIFLRLIVEFYLGPLPSIDKTFNTLNIYLFGIFPMKCIFGACSNKQSLDFP